MSPEGGQAPTAPVDPIEIAAGAWQLLPLAPGDGLELATVLADPDRDPGSRAANPGSPDDVEAWLQRRLDAMASGVSVTWTVRAAVGGELAALIEAYALAPDRSSADLGCFTAARFRRKGAARTAVGAVTRYLHGVGVHRIQWFHAVGNAPSCALADRCGFTYEGTLRASSWVHDRWVDEHLHARIATDPPVTG
jgi:RimJ/RimL family protein N-acetyltransferase